MKAMVYLKRIIGIAIVAVLAWLAFQNQHDLGTSLTVSIFKFQITLVFGFWVLLSFLAGVVLFLAIDMPRAFSLKRELRRKSNEIARLQAELDRAAAAGSASDTGKRSIL